VTRTIKLRDITWIDDTILHYFAGVYLLLFLVCFVAGVVLFDLLAYRALLIIMSGLLHFSGL
jgi:hypothetical protein